MKTNINFLTALCIMLIGAGFTLSAQVNVSVDHEKWSSVSLVKKYGVNIPFDISMEDLENNIGAIKDLQLRIVRIHNGWGLEGEDKLAETSPVTLQDGKLSYDFTTLDKILNLIKETGAKPTFVNGYGPQVLTDQFNLLPEDQLAAWGELNKLFAEHINALAIPAEIEVWDNIGDEKFFSGDAAAYTALLDPAFQTMKDLRYIKLGYGGILGENIWEWRESWNSSNFAQIPKFISSTWTSADVVDHHLYESTGLMEQCNDIANYYEGQVSSFSPLGKNAADAVSAKAAVAFYESIRKISTGYVRESDKKNMGPAGAKITKVFLNQLLDDNAGNKGLISKDGTKSPLYFALKLYNEMPVDGKVLTISEGATVQGFASSNRTLAAIALWNQDDTEQQVNLSQTGLPFTPDKIEIFRIDGTNSTNGELAVESVDEQPTSITIPANGLVVVKMATNNDNSMQKKEFAIFNKSLERTWYSYTEGWAWQTNFDSFLQNTFMGVTQGNQFGVAYKGVYVENIPDRIRVKVSSFGDPMIWQDENTACYFRIDYESADEYGPYYQKKIVFFDESNTYIFDKDHGSQIDFSSQENEWIGVDYTNPEGVVVDVNDYGVSDYSRNAIIYFYLQNPGTGINSDFIVKFEVEAVGEESGIANISKDNSAVANIYPTRISNEINITPLAGGKSQVRIFNLSGKLILESTIQGNTVFDTSAFEQGAYLVKITNSAGTSVCKIVK